MNLVSGEIVEIYIEDGTAVARVSVRGAVTRASLMFLPEARVGDTILMESGVAISKVQPEKVKEN